MERKVIGDPKFGLTLRIRQSPAEMSLEARPDPLLLYVVVAAAVALGVIGALLSSPREGLATFLTFSLLFSPLICVLSFNAIRVRTSCVLDRQTSTVRIDEQSYTRRVQEVYSLEEVTGVLLRRLPAAPFTGGSVSFGLFLALTDADYLAASSNNEATVGQDAWRISRFLDVPLDAPVGEEPSAGAPRPGVIAITAILYFMPIALAMAALLFLLERLPGIEPRLAGLLGVVIISQIGAMLAFAYYRTRRPYET